MAHLQEGDPSEVGFGRIGLSSVWSTARQKLPQKEETCVLWCLWLVNMFHIDHHKPELGFDSQTLTVLTSNCCCMICVLYNRFAIYSMASCPQSCYGIVPQGHLL